MLNRRAAQERLVDILRTATAAPPRPRRPTRPSKRAVQARIDAKRRRGETKRLRKDTSD
jgi:ribosome-associated protein